MKYSKPSLGRTKMRGLLAAPSITCQNILCDQGTHCVDGKCIAN